MPARREQDLNLHSFLRGPDFESGGRTKSPTQRLIGGIAHSGSPGKGLPPLSQFLLSACHQSLKAYILWAQAAFHPPTQTKPKRLCMRRAPWAGFEPASRLTEAVVPAQ